jgi:hypothetical protein
LFCSQNPNVRRAPKPPANQSVLGAAPLASNVDTHTVRTGPVMPERAAMVTALIMGRPLCLSCIALRSSLDEVDASAVLDKIDHVLTLRRVSRERCRACGLMQTVFCVEQPPA